MLLLIALLVQTPVEDHIAAFVKGDAAARKELVKLGAYAIRPLQKARNKGPEKIDALVYELKKAAAHPKCAQVIDNLESTMSTITFNAPVATALHAIVEGLNCPTFVDSLDLKLLNSRTFTLQHNRVPARVIVDDLCRQTGLDYALFHNHLVVGHPDRLWPSGPPVKPRALTAEETARARALVEKLGDEMIETRESATRDLLAFGPSVVPLLKDALDRKEAELVARCGFLIRNLEIRPAGVFGPSLHERQRRTDIEEKTLAQLNSVKADLQFQLSTLADVVGFMGSFSGVAFEIQPEAGKHVVTVRSRGQKLGDFLSLLTQSRGLDFIVRDRTIVIDTREALEKTLPKDK